jgi:hypothetical protein
LALRFFNCSSRIRGAVGFKQGTLFQNPAIPVDEHENPSYNVLCSKWQFPKSTDTAYHYIGIGIYHGFSGVF